MEFDLKYALAEEILCQYFYKSLQPFIRLWVDEKSQNLDG